MKEHFREVLSITEETWRTDSIPNHMAENSFLDLHVELFVKSGSDALNVEQLLKRSEMESE